MNTNKGDWLFWMSREYPHWTILEFSVNSGRSADLLKKLTLLYGRRKSLLFNGGDNVESQLCDLCK